MAELPDKTDRKRLQQIQQSDLTDSRVNQDFVFWLKTKGMNWLLVILLVLCVLMGINVYRDRAQRARDKAWADLSNATLPVALIDVATTGKGVDAVECVALVRAADQYLNSVQTGTRFDREPDATDYRLTPESREEFLGEADRLYTQLGTAAGASNAESPRAGFALASLFGRAAVAESRGQIDAAKALLDEAAALAGTRYQAIATLANQRRESLSLLASAPYLPSRASLPAAPAGLPAAPIVDDQFIRDLLTAPGEAPATPNVNPALTTSPSAPTARPQAPPPSVPPATVPPPAAAPPTLPPTAPPTAPPAAPPVTPPPTDGTTPPKNG